LSSNTSKTSCPGHPAISSKDRWIVASSLGLNIPEKLGSPSKKKERNFSLHFYHKTVDLTFSVSSLFSKEN